MAAIEYRPGECRAGREDEACKCADPANGGFARLGDVCCAVVLLEDTLPSVSFCQSSRANLAGVRSLPKDVNRPLRLLSLSILDKEEDALLTSYS